MHHLRKITGAASLFAFAVLWSNIWGQLRDSLSIALFNNQSYSAYNYALKIPFEAPQVIGVALAAAMVPVLVELCKHGRSAEARKIADGIVVAMALILGPLALAGALLSGPILHIYYLGSSNPATLLQAIRLSRILFPYLMISGVAGALAAALQSFEQFRALAFGQLIPNVVIVGSILLLHNRLGITGQAVGVVLGGVGYLALVLGYYSRLKSGRRDGDHGSPAGAGTWWRLPAARAIALAMIPLLLIGLADWIGSQLIVTRAVSWVARYQSVDYKLFTTAMKTLQIPQGVFVAALSLVLLPYLSRRAASDDRSGLAAAAAEGMRLVLFAVAPTVLVIGLLALPILNILFVHGAYTPLMAHRSAPLIALMAPYVLLSSVGEVLIICLLALKRVWPLFLVQMLTLAASEALCVILARKAGLVGIAAAVTLIALVNLVLLLSVVTRYLQFHEWKETSRFLAKLAVACAAIALWLAPFTRAFEHGGKLGVGRSLIEIVVGAVVSGIIFAGVSEALGARQWILIRSSLWRRAEPADAHGE